MRLDAPPPAGTRLVLVGGGHAHALVLRGLADAPEPGLEITLVAPDRFAPYSGMLPGHIAGLYARDEMHIDLERAAGRIGARFVRARAVGFFADARRIDLDDGTSLPFDILSIDIGITPDLDAIAGAREHAIAVKPIGDLLAKTDALIARAREPGGPRRILVVGGGAAGVCLAFALRARLERETGRGGGQSVSIVTAGDVAPEINAPARFLLNRALARAGIGVVRDARVAAIEAGGVMLADGRRIDADAVLVTSHAKAPAILANGDLARDADGFLAIDETLRVVGRERVFAAGDCATSVTHPRPKAGVFAVRQGTPLLANIRSVARGEAPRAFVPQSDWLMLIADGRGRAIGSRGRWLAFGGRLAFTLKDRIDRRFMALFND